MFKDFTGFRGFKTGALLDYLRIRLGHIRGPQLAQVLQALVSAAGFTVQVGQGGVAEV